MNRLITKIYLAITLLPIASTGAQATSSCSTGRLADVQVETRVIDAGTTERGERQKSYGGRTYNTYSIALTQQKTIYTVTVRLNDIVYSAQSETIFGFGFKPTSFVVNDPIQGCIRGNTLTLIRQDGKEYRARIVRAVRDLQFTRDER